MAQIAGCATTLADVRAFLKAGVRQLEAAAGREVLPTLTGRCVETPGRLVHASCLAAASERRTEVCWMVKSWPLLCGSRSVRMSVLLGFLRSIRLQSMCPTCSLRPSMAPLYFVHSGNDVTQITVQCVVSYNGEGHIP